MSLVNTLMADPLVPAFESMLDGDPYSGEYCENYIQDYKMDLLYEQTITDIIDIQEAALVADVIGEVRVIREGAEPQVLMEGVIENIIEGIKKFFAKIGEFFKNLFTTKKKKAEEAAKSEELARLREQVASLSGSVKDIVARDNATKVDMYPYVKDTLSEMAKLCNDYNTMATTKMTMIADTANKLADQINKQSKSKNTTYRDIDKSNAYKSADKMKDTSNWKFNSGTNYKGSGALTPEEREELKNARRYKEMVDDPDFEDRVKELSKSDKLAFDARAAELEEKIKEARNTSTYFGKLSDEEANMSLVEFLKYRSRGKATSTKTLSISSAIDTIEAATGLKVLTDEYSKFCVNAKSTWSDKEDQNLARAHKAVKDMEKAINKTIEECRKDMKENAAGYDDMNKMLSKLSSITHAVVSSVADTAKAFIAISTELSSVARAILRQIITLGKEQTYTRADGSTIKGVDRKGFKLGDDDRSETTQREYDSITRESAGLFEQAYSLGLF